MEEVKKKWQDAQSTIKKKEGERLKSTRLTGGGPAPEIFFKPWEKVILRFLSKVAISGLVEGVDTSQTQDIELSSSSNAITNENMINITAESGELQETNAEDVETRDSEIVSLTEDRLETSTNKRDERTKKRVEEEDPSWILVVIEKEKLAIKKRRLEIEEERLAVEKRKCKLLAQFISLHDDNSVTPVSSFFNEI